MYFYDDIVSERYNKEKQLSRKIKEKTKKNH